MKFRSEYDIHEGATADAKMRQDLWKSKIIFG